MRVKNHKNKFSLLKIFLLIAFLVLVGCGSAGDTSLNIQNVPPPPPSSPETSAILTWNSSTQNTDDSCTTDHGSYNVYYGTSSNNLINKISNAIVTCTDTMLDEGNECENIYECTYTVSSLTSGTWHFAVTSSDLAGNESEYSETGDKVI